MNSALISTFLWTLFVFYCPDTTWATRAEDTALLEMETKMTIIMDRMERMEAEMETKYQRMAALEVEIEAKDQRIGTLEGDKETKD